MVSFDQEASLSPSPINPLPSALSPSSTQATNPSFTLCLPPPPPPPPLLLPPLIQPPGQAFGPLEATWPLCSLRHSVLLTYLCPSLPVEHRPSTTPPPPPPPPALVIPDQLVPCCFSSASVSRLQLLRGRPLFLCPCGFQVRAWRAVLDAGFLRVCPIQPHFLGSICLATGSCPARSRRSSFQIFSCHWIL